MFSDDDRLRERVESLRIAAGASYRRAADADRQGDSEKAEDYRELAATQTRKAELHERLIGRDLKFGQTHLLSVDVEQALKLLDRFDSNPAEVVLTHAERDEHAQWRLEEIQRKACEWLFANEVRTSALREIARIALVMEGEGVEINAAALARMTGISRQTLHARLSEARRS
ncbi:hypothetical protein ACFQ2B_05565 [Streptomyces stramineus]|uniref:Uncharacterized protein n=1 Tax=Streptomyces stramineus TaxID=173861 RepID=A0ABN1B368_9ACTN